MKIARSLIVLSLLASPAVPALAGGPFPKAPTFSTLITTNLQIEGMTGDNRGNLYVPARLPGTGKPCPVWRVNIPSPALVVVGTVPAPSPPAQCAPLGLAFDRSGSLYVTEGDKIYRFFPDADTPPVADLFASGLPGANGVAFDDDGDLIVSDTARGALWKVNLDRRGNVRSRMGCDTTFTPNTLCLENVLVAHPLLEGADGIVLDRAGNIWVDANERQAVVVVDRNGKNVREVFRNAPDAATRLRNGGPLEFNTSPVIEDRRFCTANLDGNRRDNAPNSGGEVGGPGQPIGKISCMDQRLSIPGARLPVR